MSSFVTQNCEQTPCEALLEISHLLPSGIIWSLGDDRNLDAFWSGIAQAKSDLMSGICQEWGEANPCTAQRTLSRWGEILCFPIDCVDLTQQSMCDWIDLISSCGAGTEGFINALFDFVGLSSDFSVEYPECCPSLLPEDCPSEMVITGPFASFTVTECDCTWTIFEVLSDPCGRVHVPEIDCLARRYFPANMTIKYSPDCDPNIIRHIRSRVN